MHTISYSIHRSGDSYRKAPVTEGQRLVIRVRYLAEKWLKDYGSRQAVLDAVVKEQFVEVLPDEVRVWVKERKLRTSEEAEKQAEDYRQARKAELWTSTPTKTG